MKCLLFTRNFEDKNSLQSHYIETHGVNSTNWFFKALFKKKNKSKFFVRKCYRCNEIFTSQNQEKNHNFVKHYQKGGQIPIEYKPIETNIRQTIKNFSMKFDKHQNSYDFADPISLQEEFF